MNMDQIEERLAEEIRKRQRRCAESADGKMDIRKFFRPPLPQTNATRATAEPYQNHRIPAAEKELQEPTASEQPQLASGSNTAAQAPPAERSRAGAGSTPIISPIPAAAAGSPKHKAMITVVLLMI
ncbi:unnamed protein product [Pleuronectes platessa]|uniref:Uncharacterized protein n=1 Tax=Pleuronectes platessa TaxID=8262 RepID=A0A9N7TKJ5_PLEPL|nr:unnamed protein product [Pleuronectes platessa]